MPKENDTATLVVRDLGARLTPSPAQAPDARLEKRFDAAFASALALREKQIQQNYRPVVGIHKWFARRPGTLFRSLLLAEFGEGASLKDDYWKGHDLHGVIGDPFMGGGTTLYEASRLGFSVLGCDVNPMSHWLVGRAFADLDLSAFQGAARAIWSTLRAELGGLYVTRCRRCGGKADVKYFLWVKQASCPFCETINDLFPGYLLAEAERHPRNVLACRTCGALNEYDEIPTSADPGACASCGGAVRVEGAVQRGKITCSSCRMVFSHLPDHPEAPPRHRMWALEYHCPRCYPSLEGRQFASPDAEDIERVQEASRRLQDAGPILEIPDDPIPPGDETARLHRWGYRRYREMFNERQLLSLGTLRKSILALEDAEVRNALTTVFSDILRYNNLLGRYDTYALKCQDIFSVHGFPVGLIQCENNVLGIPAVGSGGFVHFVEKYQRAKEYCVSPFEVTSGSGPKKNIVMHGERIGGVEVPLHEVGFNGKSVTLLCYPSHGISLPEGVLDGVFTDPPYFANVQYAELMDFCYVWIRRALAGAVPSFAAKSTRSEHEVTGNQTGNRGIEEFADGLSKVFCAFARGLRAGRPFVFTYHHNDPAAYAPLVVAILDAGLACTAVLPAAAEMTASMHIAGTDSSILDSVFVCRKVGAVAREGAPSFADALRSDVIAMKDAKVRVRIGDVRCLASGHVARMAITCLLTRWNPVAPVRERLERARLALLESMVGAGYEKTVNAVVAESNGSSER